MRLIGFVCVAGCSATSHGTVDAPPPPDAAPVACRADHPWGTPQPLTSLNNASANDAQARLTPDELTVYFQSDRNSADVNIYTAQRASPSAPFDAPVLFTVVNSSGNDFDPSISPDGLTFAMGRDSTDILVAMRASTSDAFTAPVPAAIINSTSAEAQPYVTASSIWFISTRDGGADVFRAAYSAGAFADPQRVPELDSSSVDWLPTPSSDELEIFFASNRADPGSKGGFEVWTATRASTADPFSTPVLVPELNTATDEAPSWLSPDGCRLYLTSTRAGASYDLYMATR